MRDFLGGREGDTALDCMDYYEKVHAMPISLIELNSAIRGSGEMWFTMGDTRVLVSGLARKGLVDAPSLVNEQDIIEHRRHTMDTPTLDIDTLPAGREMDALICERVFDWHMEESPKYWPGIERAWCNSEGLARVHGHWSPSTDIAAALMSLDALLCRTYTTPDGRVFPVYLVDIHLAGIDDATVVIRNIQVAPYTRHIANNASLPLAICQALFKVVSAASH